MKDAIQNLQGSFSSLNINLFSRSVKIEELTWISKESTEDSASHTLYVDLIKLKGIHLLPLIFDKRVIVNHLEIDSANLSFIKNIRFSNDSSSQKSLKGFLIKQISLKRIALRVKEDTTDVLSGILNADIRQLRFERDSTQKFVPSFSQITCTVKSIALNHKGGLYKTNIYKVYLNSEQQLISFDSIQLLPKHAKYDFAWKAGKQVARLTLSIPKVDVINLDYDHLLQKQFIASAIRIQSFNLDVFKDKRVPFSQTAHIHLPMHYFNALKWKVKIDSLAFGLSQIRTETFPESGIAPAIITFDDVSGLLLNLDNIQEKEAIDYATLQASGFFMGKGRIEATFQLPQDSSPVYHTKGFIKDMDMTILNGALQNIANINLKSGYLDLMNFNFTYTDFGSRGSLDMAYQSLSISSLNKNKSSTNEIKTALLYLLVQRNKEIEPNLSGRVGTIDVKRDRKKHIFNIWLISILDGMRSSFLGGDKVDNQSKK
ncbi:hypothetical protein SanaruYs_00710 [Chryseotalea sanaruensis]|uniref:DUF748 domain-containing protein n=1 Tax=Chryseotalea sanaruensis TaxID=2482724 RepID=A0A401U4M6_9BACT|nr:hypothetical protein [Chryseotalea sanaruensis]GCC49857.1 hypothetical protein SanaruYs_00710 [Chryseotalea sanaruensis]